MQARLAIASAAIGFALFLVGTAAADGGNSATNAIGTSQVSPITTDPSSAVSSTSGSTSSSLPLTVGGSGGNSSGNSIGTLQAGGGNTAGGSQAVAQVSPTSAAPSAGVSTANPANAGSADAGVTLGQTPNSAQDQTGAMQVGKPAAHAHATPPTSNTSVTLATPSSGAPLSATVSPGAPQAPSVGFTPVVHLAITGDLFSLTIRPELEIAPGVSVGFDQLGTAGLGGKIAVGSTDGSSAERSLGTLQTGGVTIAPAVTAASSVLGLAFELGGGSSVDGGSSSALDTIGTAQVGGGNSADPSYGTLQIGGVNTAPTMRQTSSEGGASLGGSSGIAGGGNQATNSIGTAQVGGGNQANGSKGTAQSGPVRNNEAVTYGGTRAGSGTVGGPTQIGGNGGNTATDSIGTGQVGGGNSTSGSKGTTQVGPLGTGMGVTYADSPAGTGTIGSPTQIGGNGGNSATGSTGTAQIGGTTSQVTPAGTSPGGNSAVVLGESFTALRAPTPAATPQPAIQGTSPASTGSHSHQGATTIPARPGAQQPAGLHGVAGAKKSGQATSPSRQNLPFTGLPLWPFLLGAAALLLAGGFLRRAGLRG